MIVEDYDSEHEVTTPEELEAALRKRRDGGINSFWLSHVVDEHPKLALLVKEDLASVHYFPKERHAGFQSVAKEPGPDPYGTTVFFVRPTEKVWVVNYAIIPFSDALKAAQEFAISPTLPKSVEWDEM
jgi:hypothetical protein